MDKTRKVHNSSSSNNNNRATSSQQRIKTFPPMTKLILSATFIVAYCCYCSAQQVAQKQQNQEVEFIERRTNSHDIIIPNDRLSQKYYYYQQQHQNQKYIDFQQQQQQQQQHHQINNPQHPQQQQLHLHPQHVFSNNSISEGAQFTGNGRTKDHKKNSLAMQKHHGLNKLQRLLNHDQSELINRHPGSLLAVARALKMAIVECQYQMRHEPWDCPIYGFSMKPSDIFGKLMSRSFKETSFIHALLSSAITHSIARACTESTISTCGTTKSRDSGWGEDIDFGRRFAAEFMNATHEKAPTSMSTNSIEKDLNNNIIGTGSNGGNEAQQAYATSMEPSKRERRIRIIINNHNEALGRLLVLNGMGRVCKCHGLSGACNMQSCWNKLPPFRDVADKLHKSLDEAVRLIYVARNPMYRHKSLNSASSVKKSNKKRSSVQPVNSPTRLSASALSLNQNSNNNNNKMHPYLSNSLTTDTANLIGSRRRSSKRETTDSSSDKCENCYHRSTDVNNTITSGAATMAATKLAHREHGLNDLNTNIDFNNPTIQSSNRTVVKRRPVARSIGFSAPTIIPDTLDLLYYEESPDFCVPSERYNIKGTTGRTCSENSDGPNNCERLCCGRSYKTELREEKYKCECQFKFCCKLDCKTCTRQKRIHKCL